ncbi:hypothetical protein HPB49_020976 [Dermacentor silvarum]|uniref:Uncharacterized protein n=1 Tax=Dermacentor silvarum TaxID=543639 RepID=A0ACB8CB76_DERSI|nr:hypothetical protein HPB49_020976 [Dermacentor silvarum]
MCYSATLTWMGMFYRFPYIEVTMLKLSCWFHEHAIYDLPAQIDYVLSNTVQRQLLYIGLSQGTLSFFTMMSERPEYNDKVKAFAGLAPFHKLAHIEVPPLAIFGPYAESPLRLAQALGGYEMLPNDFQLMSLVRLLCGRVAKPVCTFLGDRLNNLGSRYINLVSHSLNSAGTKCVLLSVKRSRL